MNNWNISNKYLTTISLWITRIFYEPLPVQETWQTVFHFITVIRTFSHFGHFNMLVRITGWLFIIDLTAAS